MLSTPGCFHGNHDGKGGSMFTYLRIIGRSKKEGQKNLCFAGFFCISKNHPWLEIPFRLPEPICWAIFLLRKKPLQQFIFLAGIWMEHRAKTYLKHKYIYMFFMRNPNKSACSHGANWPSLALLCGFTWRIKAVVASSVQVPIVKHPLPRMHESINGWCVRSSRLFAKTVGHGPKNVQQMG